jgi:glyoxylase I family protein
MTIRALDHVNIRAHREVLDVLKTFYCDVLGLRAGPRPPFPRSGYWLYAGERAVVHLYEAEPAETRTTRADSTLDHFAFACDDLAGVVSTLERCGLAYRKVALPGGDVVQIFVRDPAGHSVELDFAVEAR